MNLYEIEITTVPGVADSAFLDRLAELVDGIDNLVDPALGLNEDGSISASFEVTGADPLAAAEDAVALFATAVERAGSARGASAVGGFAISPVVEPEAISA